MAYSLPIAMDQAVLDQADFEKLLECFNVNVVIEHLSSKGFLCNHEVKHIKSLSKREEVVSYLHSIMRADTNRYGDFLDEFNIFASEHLLYTLKQILELKKTRARSRVPTRKETVEKDPHSVSISKPFPLNLKPEEMKQVTLSESRSDTFECVSL